MTTEEAINRDGMHQVGSRFEPLSAGAYKYVWESDYNSSLKADGYKVIIHYTGDRGEVIYEFHWDGHTVRYLNPEAERALNSCD